MRSTPARRRASRPRFGSSRPARRSQYRQWPRDPARHRREHPGLHDPYLEPRGICQPDPRRAGQCPQDPPRHAVRAGWRGGPVGISAAGISHMITFTVDQIRQEPVIDQARHEDARSVRNGTSITVILAKVSACSQFWSTRAGRRSYKSPTTTRSQPAPRPLHSWLGGAGHCARRPVLLAKWRPCGPDLPHWYDVPDHRAPDRGLPDPRLETARADRQGIHSEFRGLSGTAKQKAVLDATGLSRAPLSRLLNGANASRPSGGGVTAPGHGHQQQAGAAGGPRDHRRGPSPGQV